MNTRFSLTTLALLLAGLSQTDPTYAAEGGLTTTVARTLVTDPNVYGGCMAELDTALSSAVPAVNCGTSGWVSFSCSGAYVSKDLAFYMLDQAQLALSLNRKVYVSVDDTKKHNGYCFAKRIDVFKY
ncbi:hypothetical protein ANRL2_00691 [Anaerolineae bacterium]|nr:hypothetical protein ANRL2_00691 [Anaerolineae bacterium]